MTCTQAAHKRVNDILGSLRRNCVSTGNVSGGPEENRTLTPVKVHDFESYETIFVYLRIHSLFLKVSDTYPYFFLSCLKSKSVNSTGDLHTGCTQFRWVQ